MKQSLSLFANPFISIREARAGIFFGVLILGLYVINNLTAFAQTPLAIHATREEIDIWKQRSVNGPYLDDWNRILSRARTFRSKPSADFWPGNQTAEVWNGQRVDARQQPPNYRPGRQLGDGLRDAGFVYLVTGDTSYRDAVRQALLRQAQTAGTNFANPAKWNPGDRLHPNWSNWQIVNWLRKLTYGYSYIRFSLSSDDQNTLDRFFRNAGTYFNGVVHNTAAAVFVKRLQNDYTMLPFGFPWAKVSGKTHWGGYNFYSFQWAWNNIGAMYNALVGAVGVLVNDATLKSHAKRFVKEWLMFLVAPDGTVGDQQRWNDDLDPTTGYTYAGTVIGSIVTTADHLARAGDFELYQYRTSFGYVGYQGGPKSLLLVLQRFANITIGQRGLGGGIRIYASTDSTLTSAEVIGPGTTKIQDTYLIPANLYYKDTAVKKAYTRTLPTSPWNGGYDPWGGDWGTYPGIRFMFGQLENIVWPYKGQDAPSLPAPQRLSIVP